MLTEKTFSTPALHLVEPGSRWCLMNIGTSRSDRQIGGYSATGACVEGVN